MIPIISAHSVEIDGSVFQYYRTGSGGFQGKRVVVLQHGFSDNGLCWAPSAEELAGDYEILMPDARGHGLSARVHRGEKIDQAADLAALMDTLGIEKAIVGGHSMGAQIAAQLGARFPRLVRALVLEDPPWFLPRPNDAPAARGISEESELGKWLADLKNQSLEQVMARCRLDHPTWPEPYVRNWCLGKMQLDMNFLAIEHHWGGGWKEDICTYTFPVLLITADPALGGIITPEIAEMARAANQNVRTVNFPGVGHHVRFAVHNEYMALVKAFLASV